MSKILISGQFGRNTIAQLADSKDINGGELFADDLAALENYTDVNVLTVGQFGHAADTGKLYTLTVKNVPPTPHVWTEFISGGTGNLSGTLTVNAVPIATGVNTLSDSKVTQDVTQDSGLKTVIKMETPTIAGKYAQWGVSSLWNVAQYYTTLPNLEIWSNSNKTATFNSTLGLDVIGAISGSNLSGTNTGDQKYSGTATVTVGGVDAGTTYNNSPVQTVIKNILEKYLVPTFSSFGISGQANPIEVGASISGAHTFIWSTTNSGNIQANSIKIYDITGSQTLFTGLANDGSENYTFPSPIQLNTSGSYVWQIEGTDTQSNIFNRNYVVNWYWRMHSGANVNATLTNSEILALANTSLATSFPGQVSFAGGNTYFWYWIPSSFAQPTIFKNHATGFSIAMETAITQSVTNAFGVAVNYKGYRSTELLADAITVDIS